MCNIDLYITLYININMHFRRLLKTTACTRQAKFSPWLPPPEVIEDWLKKEKQRRVPRDRIPLRLPADLPLKIPKTDNPAKKPKQERGVVVIDF
jgi:hypothetical protein